MILRVSLVLLALFLAGCSSVYTRIETGQSLTGRQRLWVRTNLNDNHALDEKIAAAFRASGYEVGTGPETMMPTNTQVVITYYDQWAWDFRNYMVGLTLRLRDAKSHKPIADAEYVGGPAALFSHPNDTIERVVTEVLKKAGMTQTPRRE